MKPIAIRKISIGTDPMNAMHFQIGSTIMQGSHQIQHIEREEYGYDIYIKNGANEVYVWKTINNFMPVTIEHNLDF